MSEHITVKDFHKIEIKTGTVLNARANKEARKQAYILEVDFGEQGIKISSAQLTENYTIEDLIGKQVVCVLNFPPKRIAGVKSEILVLGAMSEEEGVVLLSPDKKVENGTPIG